MSDGPRGHYYKADESGLRREDYAREYFLKVAWDLGMTNEQWESKVQPLFRGVHIHDARDLKSLSATRKPFHLPKYDFVSESEADWRHKADRAWEEYRNESLALMRETISAAGFQPAARRSSKYSVATKYQWAVRRIVWGWEFKRIASDHERNELSKTSETLSGATVKAAVNEILKEIGVKFTRSA